MILLQDVLSIHRILVEQFGGTQGIRDKAGIESAIARPYSTFEGKELYPDPEDKASAIIESIIQNHPFLDGNKRTGYVLMRLMLLNSGKNIIATEEDKYNFVIEIASGNMNFKIIRKWIKNHIEE